MKHSTKSNKHRGANPAQRASAALPVRRSSWSRSALLAICLLVAAGGTWALMEFVVWNRLPAELVGKWKVHGGEQDGAIFEFRRNGSVVGHVNIRDNLEIMHAEVRVDGDKLYITTQHPITGAAHTVEQTTKKMDGNQLVLQDGKGNRYRMERADN